MTGGSQLETTRRESDVTLRPGDPGFIIRARVPQPSNMDYVNRPRWNVEDRSTVSGYFTNYNNNNFFQKSLVT